MATSWRITEQTPVRNLGRMDYERCGALHNEIMERSWVGAGHSLESMDRTTYWDRWHNDSSWTPEHLHPSVLEFLKIAIAGTTSESFFWTVGGIYGPKVMLETNNNMYSDDEHRYITIYATNMICGVSHKAGIVLDQCGFNAVFQPSIWDTENVMFGQVWQPLEVILDNYLEMINQGKVVAFPRNGRPPPEKGQLQREGAPPWVMEPFTEIDLQQTILQWERLVEAIESRMPTATLSRDNPIGYGCFDPSSDDDFDMFPKHGFARRLLSAARRPRFHFIAPGLWCVGADAQTQPFSDLETNRYGDGRMRPVLLARGEQNAIEGDNLLFRNAFAKTAEPIPSGLYLTEYNPDRPNSWEDGCRLVLPYMIGDRGHARRSDGSFFANMFPPMIQPAVPASSSTEIHQHGHNPFVMHHDVQLKFVLQRWAELVESGYWEVDANGIAGGIEKWRDADTAEHWQKYQLPGHW